MGGRVNPSFLTNLTRQQQLQASEGEDIGEDLGDLGGLFEMLFGGRQGQEFNEGLYEDAPTFEGLMEEDLEDLLRRPLQKFPLTGILSPTYLPQRVRIPRGSPGGARLRRVI